MSTLRKGIGIAAAVVFGMLAGGVAMATPTVMTFDGMANAADGEYVANYYNGGCGDSYNGGPVDCGGPAYGVVWKGLVAGGAPDGLWDDTANQPSSPNVGGFLASNIPGAGAKGIMNVAAGFDTGFAFYYAHPTRRGGNIRIWSGLDGTGTILVNAPIAPQTGSNCGGFSEEYSCWAAFGVAFEGTARSVTFLGQSNLIRFDNITLGSSTPLNPTPVPEPAALGMFGLGVLMIGGLAALRRRQPASDA